MSNSAHVRYRASAHYTLYTRVTPEERLDLPAHKQAVYAARDYLHRVQPGDVLWLINVHVNHLFLLGRLQVEFVVDDIEVAQELVDLDIDDWEESDWYAIANRYNLEPIRELDITGIAEELSFVSSNADRLTIIDGRIVRPQELRHLRQLTEESARRIEEVWYGDILRTDESAEEQALIEDARAYAEGKLVLRRIRQRERSRQLVQDAKARFRASHGGRLYCEVCGFDFDAVYGVDYIEAHHREQMAQFDVERETTVDDLVMLCANCHRVAHTRTPPLRLDELRALIKNAKV